VVARAEPFGVSGARDQVLARIRAALADKPSYDPVVLELGHEGIRDQDELADMFVSRAGAYRATVRRTATTELGQLVDSVCKEHAARRVVVPRDLPASWCAPGAEYVGDLGFSPQELDAFDAVLTGCAVAIAETGTFVMDHGSRQGRRAISLIPDLHICVVERDQIVESVAQGFALLDPTRPLTFISGPSATSDIELERVEGVHGPRQLEILITGCD
jgi:L-lactate dehydrogenase complex protein LldG